MCPCSHCFSDSSTPLGLFQHSSHDAWGAGEDCRGVCTTSSPLNLSPKSLNCIYFFQILLRKPRNIKSTVARLVLVSASAGWGGVYGTEGLR